jgi:uncharacterized protein (TIGR02246 family)
MDEWKRLLDARACEQLVLQAAAAVDAGDAAALAALFLPDGELVRPGGEPLRGRAAIAAATRARAADRITRHLVSNSRIEWLGDDAARVQSLVTLWAGSSADTAGPRGRPARGAPVVGAFDDRLQRTTEGWRIARREASFTLHGPE